MLPSHLLDKCAPHHCFVSLASCLHLWKIKAQGHGKFLAISSLKNENVTSTCLQWSLKRQRWFVLTFLSSHCWPSSVPRVSQTCYMKRWAERHISHDRVNLAINFFSLNHRKFKVVEEFSVGLNKYSSKRIQELELNSYVPKKIQNSHYFISCTWMHLVMPNFKFWISITPFSMNT
jgi:hypothetical protein